MEASPITLPSSSPLPGAATPRAFRCNCGRQLFFRNSRCLGCEAALGYVPSRRRVYCISPGDAPSTWRLLDDGSTAEAPYRRCANFATAAACNWLIEPEETGSSDFCKACRLNRTIPNLSVVRNRPLWLSMERAKRRLVSQLIGLGLPVASKVSEDPQHGLAYDFLSSAPGQPRVLTGYAGGVITINLEEADDAVRERTRVDMGEPYRTLLGHFRHEVGHYYWTRLIAGGRWLPACRQLFGDERRNYAAALKNNYEHGAPPHWQQRYISAYASIHPSEDWAECWAHYLHLRDTLDTAASFGIDVEHADVLAAPFGPQDLWEPTASDAHEFLDMLHRWIVITGVMNEMSRAMGQQDFYPFVLPRSAAAKLHFIHCAISETRLGQGSV